MKKVYHLPLFFPFFFAFSAFAAGTCTLNGRIVPCDVLAKQAGNFIGFFGVFIFVIMAISLAGTIFWVLMLIHAATHPIENKVAWILILVFTHLLGAIIYYIVVKRKYNVIPPPPAQTPTQTPPQTSSPPMPNPPPSTSPVG